MQVVQGSESRLRASRAPERNIGKFQSPGSVSGLSQNDDHSDWEAVGAHISAGRTFPPKVGWDREGHFRLASNLVKPTHLPYEPGLLHDGVSSI